MFGSRCDESCCNFSSPRRLPLRTTFPGSRLLGLRPIGLQLGVLASHHSSSCFLSTTLLLYNIGKIRITLFSFQQSIAFVTLYDMMSHSCTEALGQGWECAVLVFFWINVGYQLLRQSIPSMQGMPQLISFV